MENKSPKQSGWRKASPDQQFYDGDQLLVAVPVKCRHGGKDHWEYSVVVVSCDTEHFDMNTDEGGWGWSWPDVEWWIPLSKFRLPVPQANGAPPKTFEQLLADYRAARSALLACPKFAPGDRVHPPGVTSPSWLGTVVALDEHSARSTSADMVFVKWDCGNRYEVVVDEIEVLS